MIISKGNTNVFSLIQALKKVERDHGNLSIYTDVYTMDQISSQKPSNMKYCLIGKVGVDGGSIVINDPCTSNLIQDFDSSFTGVSKEMDFPSAMLVNTGSGNYPVYLIYDKELQDFSGILIWVDKDITGRSVKPSLTIEKANE